MRSAATIKTRIVYCCQFLGKRYVSRNQLYRNAICAEDLRSKNRGQQRQTIHTINITVKRGKARTKRERETRIYGGRWITNEITNEITMSTGRRTKGHAKCIRGGTRKYGVMLVKRRREGEEGEERERERAWRCNAAWFRHCCTSSTKTFLRIKKLGYARVDRESKCAAAHSQPRTWRVYTG